MKVINLFGGPCTGKSTLAASLFAKMKVAGYNVELVTEYAKDLTWEERHNILEKDQLYIFTKQHRKLLRIKDNVDYAITDSPLPLSIFYNSLNPTSFYPQQIFNELVLSVYNKYANVNFFLVPTFVYQEDGRNQTRGEALALHHKLYDFIGKYVSNIVNLHTPDMTKNMTLILKEL